MANFDNIIQEINTNLPDNNAQEITAKRLRDTLVDLTTTIDTVQDDFESSVSSDITTIENKVDYYTEKTIGIDEVQFDNTTQLNDWVESFIPDTTVSPESSTYNGAGANTDNLTEDTVINKVVFPPFRVNAASTTIDYIIFYANGSYSVTGTFTPNLQNVIKTGKIEWNYTDTGYDAYWKDYTITLDSEITIPAGNGVYVLLYTYDYRISLLMGDTSMILPNITDYGKILFLDSASETPFDALWSRGSVNSSNLRFRTIPPKLLYQIEGKVTEIENNIDSINESIAVLPELEETVSGFDSRITTNENDIDEIVNTTDETVYIIEGEKQYYEENGAWDGWRGVGTNTELLTEDTVINQIVLPRMYASSSSPMNAKYCICYRPVVRGNFNPSTASTIIATGIIEGLTTTSIDNYTITLDNPVTIPAGNSVYVLVYGESASISLRGGGTLATETPAFDPNSNRYAYLTTNTSIWDNPFNVSWSVASVTSSARYRVTAPILRYYQKSIIDERIDEAISGVSEDVISQVEAQIDTTVNEAITNNNAVGVYLPDTLYAVVGDTLQVFYQGCVGAYNTEIYNIYANCSKGKTFPRYFEYTPTVDDIGTTTLTIYVKDNKTNTILGQGSCSLVTVAAPSSPSNPVNVFTFGDSLTTAGVWCGEAKRRLVGTSTYDSIVGNGLSNIEFYGYKTATINNQEVDYFGVGGWTWASYITKGSGGAFRFYVNNVNSLSIGATYTNNGFTYTVQEINVTGSDGNIRCTTSSNSNVPETSGTLTKTSGDGDATITFASFEVENANPLWDDTNNKMSFIPYVQNCGASTIDVVYTLLTWNGQGSWKEYSGTQETDQIGYAKTFARTLHNEYPNAKLKIIGLQMPSITGGLGYNYGASGSLIDPEGVKQTALNYNKALQDMCNLEEFSSYCEYVGAAPQFDTLYNMPYRETNVNKRNSVNKEMLGSNGVHPDTKGYYQFADAVYRNFVANFCQ